MVNKKIEKGNGVESNVLEKYRKILPEQLIRIWEEYGFCSLLNGYLRMVNPDEYQELLKETYHWGENAVPILTTAFGDVITLEKDDYIGIVKYKNGCFRILAKNFKRFWQNFEDPCFVKEYFDFPQYSEAIQKLGMIKSDECYGYVPLLGLGGKETVDNLKKVKIKEHIEIIGQMTGMI